MTGLERVFNVPNRRGLSVRTNGRNLAGLWSDVKNRPLAIADAAAHSGVDEKQPAAPLIHLADIAMRFVGEEHVAVVMAFHDVGDA